MNEILTEPPEGIGAVVQCDFDNGQKIIVVKVTEGGPSVPAYTNKYYTYSWNNIKDLNPILLLAGYTPPVPQPKICGVVRGVCEDARDGGAMVFSKVGFLGKPWYHDECPCGKYWHAWVEIKNPEVIFEGVDK